MATNSSIDQNKLYLNKLKEEITNLNIRNDKLITEKEEYRGKVE